MMVKGRSGIVTRLYYEYGEHVQFFICLWSYA
jgi:hypothetical protein